MQSQSYKHVICFRFEALVTDPGLHFYGAVNDAFFLGISGLMGSLRVGQPNYESIEHELKESW